MATSSFFHNVVIKDEAALKRFIEAAEESEKRDAKPVKINGKVEYAGKDWIKKNIKK
jgi:hypothetical protein